MLRVFALLAVFAVPFPAALAQRSEPPPAQRAALEAMERLRGEIVLLTELAAAQEALLARNRGLERQRREALTLCEELPAWCRMLPATFGRTP